MKKRAEMLFMAAQECATQAEGSLGRSVWNMAIRRAQEAVELELTGVMALIDTHYPKDHDQAPMLLRMLAARDIEIDANTAKEIERISADLSRKRGPALQQEEGYDEEEAKRSIANMRYVLVNAEKIKNKL